MRHLLILSTLALVVACSGGEANKPAAKPPEPAKVETKAPEAPATPPATPPAAPAAAAPGGDITADALKALPADQQKAKLMELGEKVYKTGGSGGLACITCHQENGMGLPPSFPPLKGSKDFYGDCTKHAGFVVKGLNGEITVQGTKFNGAMPAQANLSDLEIAAVITYERNSWGNADGICLPDAVAAARK